MFDEIKIVIDEADRRTRLTVWYAKIGKKEGVMLKLDGENGIPPRRGWGCLHEDGDYEVTWLDDGVPQGSYRYLYRELRRYLHSKWPDECGPAPA